MNFRQLDLNLLRVLTALYRTGSVTAAGKLLSLSQPATSHALAKLRSFLNDDLFVRTPQGLKPTHLCERIAPEVQAQLQQLEVAISGRDAFDHNTSDMHWRVSLSDLGEMMFLPALAHTLRELAPQAKITNVSVPATEVPAALVSRDVDLAIGILHPRHRGIQTEALFEENYVALTAQHWRPATGRVSRTLSLAQLQKAQLVVASPTATFHAGVEKILSAFKLNQQIVLRARHFGAIPELVLRTDLLAIVPKMYATELTQHRAVRVWKLPITSLNYVVNMVWHSSTQHDPRHAWLRQQVRQLFTHSTP